MARRGYFLLLHFPQIKQVHNYKLFENQIHAISNLIHVVKLERDIFGNIMSVLSTQFRHDLSMVEKHLVDLCCFIMVN